jgi:WD40 repeat protein
VGGCQVCTLRGHSESVKTVAFSGDGKRIVSGSYDRLVKIWNSETGVEVCNRGECTRW